MAGTITASWTVICGVCEATRELPEAHTTRSSALTAANNVGWHHRIKRGWVCPDCWHQGDNMQITCDLIDLGDMFDGVQTALGSPPRAGDRLRELRAYICGHCADKGNGQDTRRCSFCKISEKNT